MFLTWMTRPRLVLFTTTVLLIASMGILWTQASEAQRPPDRSDMPVMVATDPLLKFVPDRVIIKLKPGIQLGIKAGAAANMTKGTNNPGLDQAFAAIGVRAVDPVFPVNPISFGRAANIDNPLARIYRLILTPGADVAAAIGLLRAREAIEYAEPDYIAHATLIPNDPEWISQWALSKINAPTAWDATQGADTTIIALIDSGIAPAHQDMNGKLWRNDDIADNGVDDDQNGKIDDTNGWNFVEETNNIADPNGHGTQVAGVAGAIGNNGLGIAGLCWQCSLMPVVAMQVSDVANYSTVAEAVLYAAANGAAVINLSLGGYADSSMLREAIAEAATTAVIVAAAGNDDDATPFYPAAYPEVIAVAATDTADQKTVFSNYGAWVDIAAPGTEVLTTAPNGYTAPSGTSVATPLVAGVAGLLKSLHPDWSPALITWQIVNTATWIDGNNPTYAGQLGYGRLDAGAALRQFPEARARVEGYTVDGQSSGRPAPGQSFPLVLTLRNTWMPGQDVVGSVTTTDPYVTIVDGQGMFGDLEPGETRQNNNDPFVIMLQPQTPYNHNLLFTLTLTGATGYTTTTAFALQVRTDIETLGNTQYIQNTTWTSDKTYVLNGAVIVGQGVTLTIQPGTVVKGNPGKFIRIDGTLVARGTTEQPITFTTNATDNAQWGGLRFADTAISASFDLTGTYVAGSILHHVAVSYATTGVNLGTRTPYLADSTLHHNVIALQSNHDVPRIERNAFYGNVTAISLAGGSPLIISNSFTRNRNEMSGSAVDGNGSPQILGNVFTAEGGYAVIRLTINNSTGIDSVSIRNNRIVDNVGGIQISSAQTVTIEGNVIANNRLFCFPEYACVSTDAAALAIDTHEPSNSVIRNNTIINNGPYGLRLSGSGTKSVSIINNNLFGNGGYDLYLLDGSPGTQNFTVNAINNFWNIETSAIAGRIHDCTFDENGCDSSSSTVARVEYVPPLAEPSQNAPAFVQSATLMPDPVGLNQLGTATVDFSRPMITVTAPMVSFHDARRGTQEKMGSSADVMAEDALGRMWFGGSNGARMFDGRQWYTYTMSNSGIGSNQIDTVYGAANGDVWFANLFPSVPNHVAPLSRLRGSTWITYTDLQGIPLSGIRAISEDATGGLWFADSQPGVVYFDGVKGRRFTTADGLGYNSVSAITNDKNGNLWFIAHDDLSDHSGITRFDGTTWQTYREGVELPTPADLGPILADSQGQVWLSVQDAIDVPTGGKYIGMFSNGIWTFWGSREIIGQDGCTLNGFTEAADGAVWMLLCGRIATFQNDTWASISYLTNVGSPMLFDAHDNLWTNATGLHVLWRGLDYPFDTGQWLSPTRYQSTYNFTALVPQGLYVVVANHAVDPDGIAAVPDAADTFRVDFGIAANPAPPFTPVIVAQNDGSLTTLSASWHSDSLDIDHYRYAIGTTPGARDVVGWTYLTAHSMTRSDLTLAQGQPYYVSVQARNQFGLWSITGISNQVIGGVITVFPTPATATPGGPTATPAAGTPTPTPTITPVDEGPTPTPTLTPVPAQKLDAIGETSGAPGSRFIFTGSGFPPNTQLPVAVTSLSSAVAAGPQATIGTVTTDATGAFSLTLQTTPALAPGHYRLTVGTQQSAVIEFEVDRTAPLLQPDAIGAVLTITTQVYLPMIQR